jgi:hypothetical protein
MFLKEREREKKVGGFKPTSAKDPMQIFTSLSLSEPEVRVGAGLFSSTSQPLISFKQSLFSFFFFFFFLFSTNFDASMHVVYYRKTY